MGGKQGTERTSANGDNASSTSAEKTSVTSVAADSSSSTTSDAKVYRYPEVGTRWQEIQGQNKWENLLDPIDPLLRSELIRYGDFAQSTYDAFDNDGHTRFTGSCRFAKERLLEKTQIFNSGYEVTDYLYSTAGTGVPQSFLKLVDSGDTGQANLSEVWSTETNWNGYVAVTTDPTTIKRLGRRDILVAWRGTVASLEWINNLQDRLIPAGLDPRRKGQTGTENLKVEQGFLNLYTAADPNAGYIPSRTSAREQVLSAVCRLVRKYKDEELSITVTGHSLGAALAVLSAYDIAESSVNQPEHLPDGFENRWSDLSPKDNPDDVVDWTDSQDVKTVPVTVFSFAGPRVGNNAFRDRVEALKVRVLRVVNKNDIVPLVPGVLVNETSTWLNYLLKPVRSFLESLPWTYIHVGESLKIDNLASPYLQSTTSPLKVHNLEACYLHVLTGYQGSDDFKPLVPRDLALVNKGSALLLTKYLRPEDWWQMQFKSLVRVHINGIWVTFPRERVDYPEYFDPTTVEKICVKEATPTPDAALEADAIATVDASPSTAGQ